MFHPSRHRQSIHPGLFSLPLLSSPGRRRRRQARQPRPRLQAQPLRAEVEACRTSSGGSRPERQRAAASRAVVLMPLVRARLSDVRPLRLWRERARSSRVSRPRRLQPNRWPSRRRQSLLAAPSALATSKPGNRLPSILIPRRLRRCLLSIPTSPRQLARPRPSAVQMRWRAISCRLLPPSRLERVNGCHRSSSSRHRRSRPTCPRTPCFNRLRRPSSTDLLPTRLSLAHPPRPLHSAGERARGGRARLAAAGSKTA